MRLAEVDSPWRTPVARRREVEVLVRVGREGRWQLSSQNGHTAGPAEERVAGRLHEPLPDDHALPLAGDPLELRVVVEHGRRRVVRPAEYGKDLVVGYFFRGIVRVVGAPDGVDPHGKIQVAHELERVGDRATNIAERVIYAETGELIELNL